LLWSDPNGLAWLSKIIPGYVAYPRAKYFSLDSGEIDL